jgi:hypothetical protein
MTSVSDGRPAGLHAAPPTAQERSRRPPGWNVDAAASIEDAEFETVRASVRHDPLAGRKDQAAGPTVPAEGLSVLRRGARRRMSWTGLLAVVAVASGAGLWVSEFGPGHLAVAAVPSDLRIEGVTTYVEPGRPDGLFFSGTVVNTGGRDLRAPPLAVAVQSAGKIVARYYLGTSSHLVAARQRFNFSGRLPTPMDGAETVRIYFNARDDAARESGL